LAQIGVYSLLKLEPEMTLDGADLAIVQLHPASRSLRSSSISTTQADDYSSGMDHQRESLLKISSSHQRRRAPFSVTEEKSSRCNGIDQANGEGQIGIKMKN
jgi:hypothetical protein